MGADVLHFERCRLQQDGVDNLRSSRSRSSLSRTGPYADLECSTLIRKRLYLSEKIGVLWPLDAHLLTLEMWVQFRNDALQISGVVLIWEDHDIAGMSVFDQIRTEFESHPCRVRALS